MRPDDEEDAAAVAAAGVVRDGADVPYVGLRCKSLEASTRRRAVRTLDVFLEALGPPPPGSSSRCPR